MNPIDAASWPTNSHTEIPRVVLSFHCRTTWQIKVTIKIAALAQPKKAVQLKKSITRPLST
jgi:hypothetical protein